MTCASVIVSIAAGLALAQQPAQNQAAAQKPAESDWATQCTAKARQAAVECSVQQSVVKSDTRQLVAMFGIRVPADTRSPVMMIQLPLGLYLPAGVEVQVDQGKALPLPLQTCDANGCYAGAPVAADLLQQLRAGKTLRLTFQNLSQSKVDLSMPLEGFAAAYDSVK